MKYVAALLILLAASQVRAQQDADVVEQDVRGLSRPGFTLAIGTIATNLDLGDDADQLFSTGPVDIDRFGRGGMLEVGYAFTREFSLQLRAVGAEHSTGNPDQTFGFGQIQLDAIVTLHSSTPVWPYFAGGIGGVTAAVEEDGKTNWLAGGAMDFGGGVEVMLSRHFALSFDYRFALQNYETETVENEFEERDVDLSSTSQTLQFRVVYSF